MYSQLFFTNSHRFSSSDCTSTITLPKLYLNNLETQSEHESSLVGYTTLKLCLRSTAKCFCIFLYYIQSAWIHCQQICYTYRKFYWSSRSCVLFPVPRNFT